MLCPKQKHKILIIPSHPKKIEEYKSTVQFVVGTVVHIFQQLLHGSYFWVWRCTDIWAIFTRIMISFEAKSVEKVINPVTGSRDKNGPERLKFQTNIKRNLENMWNQKVSSTVKRLQKMASLPSSKYVVGHFWPKMF